MRVLVLGSQGMLGQAVFRLLSARGWEVIGTQFTDPAGPWYLDASAERERWQSAVAAANCDYLVNCIGILKPAILEESSESLRRAIRVNALFPYDLAAVAAETGARILQISTDGVFGSRLEPYTEDDAPDAADSYGRTKYLGECPASNALHIRCSIIGRDAVEGKGLLEWLLRQPDGGEISGYADAMWNGVTTLQFARLCEAIIHDAAFDRIRSVSRVHHYCPNPVTSKYDLLRIWQAVTGKNVRIRPVPSPVPGSRILQTRYTCLRELQPQITTWCDTLSELR